MRTRDELVLKLGELEKEYENLQETIEKNKDSKDYEVQEQMIYLEIDIEVAKDKVDLIKWVLNEEMFPIEAIK